MPAAQKYAVSGTVLIVDDDAEIRRSLGRILTQEGFVVSEAASGEQALQHLEQSPVDVVLLDVMMPGIDGMETCRRIRQNPRLGLVPVVFTTVLGDRESRIEGKKAGADDFLVKPIDETELSVRVRNLVLVRRYYQHLEDERSSLKRTIEEQTDLLSKAMIEIGKARLTLRRFNEEIVFRLSKAVEFRDDETGNHVQRMSRYCGLIASRLGLDSEATEAIRIASALHDVGKIAIPDDILHKPGRLTQEEFVLMRRHADKGHRMLTGSESNLLELAATIAWSHHERFDGKGYPRGLKGKDIPIEGRIAAVADVYDALTSKRVYKAAFSVEEASKIMTTERGVAFDPQIIDIFFAAFEDVRNIMIVHADR